MTTLLRGDEKFVIGSVANAFSAASRAGENPPEASLKVEDREVAVEISRLVESRNDGRGGTVSQRSDFMPAKQLAEELDNDLQEEIRTGAPVRLDLKE